MNDIEELRKEVKKLRVDKCLDHKGSLQKIHAAINNGEPLPYRSLVMAMTGYRNGPRSRDILMRVKEYLLASKIEQVSRDELLFPELYE